MTVDEVIEQPVVVMAEELDAELLAGLPVTRTQQRYERPPSAQPMFLAEPPRYSISTFHRLLLPEVVYPSLYSRHPTRSSRPPRCAVLRVEDRSEERRVGKEGR